MSTDKKTRPPKCRNCGMFLTDDPTYASQRCVCAPGLSRNSPHHPTDRQQGLSAQSDDGVCYIVS